MTGLFEQLTEDNTSGSGAVLNEAVEILLRHAREHAVVDAGELFRALDGLYSAFPNFALLFHFVRSVEESFPRSGKIESGRLERFLTEYKERYRGAQRSASERFLKEIDPRGKNILVHSHSSAVCDLFFLMAERNLFPGIWQTVSSPAGEGAVQAQKLASAGFNINFFHEDALSLFVQKIDFAVFGADMVLNRSFINKTATYPLSLMLRRFDKPVYLLAEKRKIINEEALPEEAVKKLTVEKPKPEYELPVVPAGEKITVHNYYFEQIPLTLVTKVFV